MLKMISATASLDFANIGTANTCAADLTITVPGAADGDPVDRILEAYPALTREDVKAALKFAAEAVNTADFIQFPKRAGR